MVHHIGKARNNSNLMISFGKTDRENTIHDYMSHHSSNDYTQKVENSESRLSSVDNAHRGSQTRGMEIHLEKKNVPLSIPHGQE